MLFDIKTLITLYLIVNVISAGAVAFILSQNQGRFAGISFWLVGLVLQVAGSTLIVLRGLVPDLISMTLANTMLIAGLLVTFIGLERFTGKKGWQIHNYILLAVFIALSAYFAVVQPNLVAREITLSAVATIYTFQCCWLLLSRVDPGIRQITGLTGLVFAIYAASTFGRIILIVIVPEQGNDFFKSGAVSALTITTYIVLTICLAISLVLMVHRRLLDDVKSQEEKFTTAFNSSPYAITLTRPSDGRIFEVNGGFVNITGYRYAEVIGKTTLDLNLWVNEEDRLAVVSELAQGRGVNAMEYQFRKKTGQLLTGLFSATLITVNNEKCILSNIGDITEHKLAERGQEIQRNLGIKLSQESDLNQALQVCLEAAMEVSSMDSGGIYLVDPDTGALDLIHNSGLSQEFIKNSSHYAKSSANTSLVMSGKPVYSDYSQISLSISKQPESEGLKAMAVVPVSSGNRVVACLNIGSHSAEEIPLRTRNAIETIASQIGGAIERMQARAMLSRSERKYRLLAENMNDIIWVLDMNLRTTYVSPSVESALGFKSEERMKQAITEQLTPASLSVALDTLSSELAHEQTGDIKPNRSIIIESEYYHKNGATKWFENVVTGIRNDQGILTGLQGISRDISERKQAAVVLKESDEQYRLLANNMTDSVWLMDMNLNVK